MTALAKPYVPTLLLIALLAACGGKDKAAPPGGPGAGMPPPEVEVISVAAGEATMTQDLPGRLEAYRTAQVRARVEGVVEKRLFKEGSEVKAGAPLYRIDARSYRATAAAAQADQAIARQTVERYKSLLEIKAVSQQEYDLAVAKAKQAEAAMIRAEEDLENANVPAPISGHIGRASVTEGALVGKGEATLLATIEQLDPIYVNFTQSGNEVLRLKQSVAAGRLKRADAAEVELLMEDGSVFPLSGQVFFTDMAVDPATGSVSLRAEFPNPRRDLLPGMFVRIRFPEAVAENVIRVPQRAVMAGAEGQFVMVVGPEGKVMPQPVKTGGMAGTDFVIASGLKGGEQVIVNGLQKARPGTVVKPVPFGAAGAAANAASAPANKQ
ncbi:MAG TPA: efflux transporter periplasmic adaptor subunit [Gallionellaceae bacterium]|nr:efflux transporter periplasmic adaptor subunit [Gallionellaceae bacterium]